MSLDLSDVDGTLYKWTNYWGGWQPRWFVLSNGILAYYSSYEESSKGCKASLNVSAGEVKVHMTDNTRFDIILHHDQHWYLKASTAMERQKWLIALGTAKARKCEFSAVQEIESDVNKNEMQTKVSELRLYCDLLSNQVLQLKEEAGSGSPDVNKLSETSSMLVATCDTFLNTLTKCMKMAEGNFTSHSHRKPSDDIPTVLLPAERHKSRHKERHAHRSISVDDRTRPSSSGSHEGSTFYPVPHAPPESYSAPTTPLIDPTQPPLGDAAKTLAKLKITNTPIPTTKIPSMSPAKTQQKDSGDSKVVETRNPGDEEIPEKPVVVQETIKKDQNMNENHVKMENKNHKNGAAVRTKEIEERQLTFFSGMLHSFTDIVLEEDGGVPTVPFLSACEDLLPFFDAIGSTAFAPVKMDLMGNIKKLRTKQLTNPAAFCIIQNMIREEINSKTTKVRNSATDALLWLKRGLRFIQKLLEQLKDGETDMTLALNTAYSATLKIFHGWVVKGIFALAVKAAPYHEDFLRALSLESFPYESPGFVQVLCQDLDNYCTALDVVLKMLDDFYEKNSLEDKTVV